MGERFYKRQADEKKRQADVREMFCGGDGMERQEHIVGKSVKRVDAFEKVTGRAKYTDDLCGKEAYVAKFCMRQLHTES